MQIYSDIKAPFARWLCRTNPSCSTLELDSKSERTQNVFRIMKLTGVLTVLPLLHLSAALYSQQVTFKGQDVKIKDALRAVTKQTGYGFLYNSSMLDVESSVSINLNNVPLSKAIEEILAAKGLSYKIEEKTIVLLPKRDHQVNAASGIVQQQQQQEIVKGKVTDEQGSPLSGATILVKGQRKGTTTDAKGYFEIKVPKEGCELQISFVGYEKKEVKAKDGLSVILFATGSIEEVTVSSGYFKRSKDSNTGSQITVSGDDLRKIGFGNILQSLSAYDPAVQMKENLDFGSDPNRIPDLTIRGENSFDLRSSADDGRTNPNAPLFMLDGIQTSAERIYDLDINRIESISILKDASATALYGSRGANGVIMIQTVPPKAGEIRVTLNSSMIVSTPDLRDYNLMNAMEKLQYEKLAGVWTDKLNNYESQMRLDQEYNERHKEALRGVDTYWLSQPLRTSINQRHNVYFEGGDRSFRYGITVRSERDKGVMIGSDRNKTGLGFNFNYDIGQRFMVRNQLFVDESKGMNSPYGSFANFARQNPNDRIFDEQGNYLVRLSSGSNNPLLDANLPQKDYSKYLSIQNNLTLDWRIIDALRLQGQMSLTKRIDKSEVYRSPFSTDFANETDTQKKGRYTTMNSEQVAVDGNMTLAYIKVMDKHVLNLGVGSNVTTDSQEGAGFTATGFLNDEMTFVEYAAQFQENSKPKGLFEKSKMIGFFSNVNYGFDNRYFIDASYRTDGSSKFGRDSRFAPFWSVGAAWNVHRESFWNPEMGTLKVRASAGSTGMVNFSSSQALTKYNYRQDSDYNGNLGAILVGYGNDKLKWQNTLAYNAGVDLSLFNNVLQVNLDGYIKLTDNLLLPIDVAPSTGFGSYVENMGQMRNAGIDTRFRFNLINDRTKRLNWNITLAALSNRNKITKLSNALEEINKEANSLESTTVGRPLRTIEAGRSQSALMVVRSAGIDPATGNEIYIKRNGDYTFDYDYRDKVIVGDTKADLEGNFTSNLNWRGFNLYTLFQYRFGGKVFNQTFNSKVEGANPLHNADRRVLYDRWIKPGDQALFKRIDDQSATYQTTRFVQDDDLFSLGAVSLSYDLQESTLKRLKIERVRFMLSTTDVFRISTVKAERGTAYPFARTFTGGLNITF